METLTRKSKRARADRKRYEEKKLLRAQSHRYNPAPMMDPHSIPQQPAIVLPVPTLRTNSSFLPTAGASQTHSAPPYNLGGHPSTSSQALLDRCIRLNTFTSVTPSTQSDKAVPPSNDNVQTRFGLRSVVANPIDILIAVETAGQEHLERVMAAGIDFDQIADDDWETQEEDEDGEEQPPARCHSDEIEVQLPADHRTLVIEDPREENDPDPFNHEVDQIEPVYGLERAHPHLAVYLLYMLMTWLHTQFHLPF
ncbi:hypothetical protein K435DRAFT_851059 [Dendrothele bispora CBS 962.96]|uniref:Uncharacterized protein n=1 Tax=Dendrothele bispora (strain CBS 962.96) TaxID=1314807 RepID=A0A4S8MNE2_DENBC|nr:hypothetical protein K435DRAFT_851059 [Dendrothele bispora CBS 962.96]